MNPLANETSGSHPCAKVLCIASHRVQGAVVALQTLHHFFGLPRNRCSRFYRKINNCCDRLTAICWREFSGPSWSAIIAAPSFQRFNRYHLDIKSYKGSRQMKQMKTNVTIQLQTSIASLLTWRLPFPARPQAQMAN